MNTGSLGFCYTTDERAVINACTRRELNDGDWLYIQTIAADYLCDCFQITLSNRRATQIENLARKLEWLLKDLSPARGGSCLWSPKISVWLKSLGELQAWAKVQLRPKSQRKRSNRARPDALDGYLAQLVQFFMRCGGHAGKAPSSPCADFVVATASPVLAMTHFELGRNAISNLIRSRVWLLGQDFSNSPPEIGRPTLTPRA
jgi:hypothetical protein